MRIAVSGTHRVGKTTLAELIGDALAGHDIIDEPYHDMVADGHVFSHPPTDEDFEDQLEYSLATFSEPGGEAIFDRCPVDLLAYLLISAADRHAVLDRWVDRVRSAVQSLDLVVLVPIESPDRIHASEEDDQGLSRHAVDAELRDLLVHDRLGVDIEILEVRGSRHARSQAVLQRLARP